MSRGDHADITEVPFERLADLARFCLPEQGNPEFPPDRVDRMFASRLEWLRRMWERGLRAWMAYAAAEVSVGFIECLPIEAAPRGVKGNELTFVTCLWVKPASARGCGVASALLNAAEEDARLRSRGMAAVAYERSQHKPAEFFYRHGYSPVSSRRGRVIVFKAFSGEARPPAWLEAKPGLGLAEGQDAGRPRVALFWSGQCPYFFSGAEDLRGWAAAAGRAVDYREIRTDDRAVAELYGVTGGIFVNGVQVDDGPPSRDDLWRLLDRATGLRR
ncbi:MAG: GNAT family N-acetyltransferase [Bacillota bacterium]|nr:GNAT family N-acetyltransferase [Bacillota bacterium]MDI7249706.1 GNAT family N-acetyltransferase [Bacillota bacterium]